MQSQQRAIDELRKAYAAFNRGDIDAAIQLLDPNVEWIEPAEFPGGGAYHGREGAKRYLMQSRAGAAEVISEPERFIVVGDRIVVFVHARVLPKNSSTSQEVRLADVYTFEGERVTQMHAFANRATRFARLGFRRSRFAKWSNFAPAQKSARTGVEQTHPAYRRCLPLPAYDLRSPKKRPMSAPNITVAMIAAPCDPSECLSVEYGQAMRQPALIAILAPAPYSAPATVGRIASELRNIQLNSKTRTPPATVLPTPHTKSITHSGTRIAATTPNVLPTGLIEKVDTVMPTTISKVATGAE